MGRFWDERAAEEPFWFVDSRLEYGAPDEEAFWRGGVEALDRLLGALGAEIEEGSVVLDLGCGLGRLTRPLAARAARVIAIDVSGKMLQQARRLNPGLRTVEWVQGDGTTLRPVEDASVDAVVSHVVLRHIPDPAVSLGYIAEMSRVLRPGGFAAIEFSNDPAPHRRDRLRDVRVRVSAARGRAPRGVTGDAWLGSWLDVGEVRRTAARAGLTVEKVVGEGTEYCAALLRRVAAQPTGGGIAAYYDRYWTAGPEPVHHPDAELAARVLDGVGAGTAVLDLGCGRGNSYAPELARRAASYVGVDVSPAAVAAARERGLDARVVEDGAPLPFADASFDHVVCVEVLEHLFAPQELLAEARRVLRPGGRLVVSVPNAAYWRLRVNLLLGVWNPTGDALSVEQPWRDPHLRFFTAAALERLLAHSGFRRIEIGAHGGRGLDHATARRTAFGQGRLYRRAERRRPALLGAELHAVAER